MQVVTNYKISSLVAKVYYTDNIDEKKTKTKTKTTTKNKTTTTTYL